VAKWTKASVLTHTVAGPNSATGGIFLQAVTVSGEIDFHPPPGYGNWQIPTDAHLKIRQNKHTCVQNLQYLSPQFHRLMTSVVGNPTPQKNVLYQLT